ncbi:MAG: Crp/Fnr family transcriptional regulator, partial [Flavobacteriaceae bacterium]|nr:Crp/Fnr family transcriptional regulator [Flavobacteriaceae bacterium]
ESRLKRREAFENYNTSKEQKQLKTIEDLLIPENLSNYKKDNTIYSEGNYSKYLYFIEKGEVKTYKITYDGKELITGMYKERDYFGFSSFIPNSPHSENAVCISNCTIYRFLKEDVVDLVEKNHLFAFEFMEHLSKNVKEVKEQLLQMAYGSVRKKTASTLLNLAKKSSVENEINISRSDLASLTGIAKETLIRTLTDFKEEGLISTSRNIVKIINPDKLIKIL